MKLGVVIIKSEQPVPNKNETACCLECGYLLHGLKGKNDRCPECGTSLEAFAEARVATRVRQKKEVIAGSRICFFLCLFITIIFFAFTAVIGGDEIFVAMCVVLGPAVLAPAFLEFFFRSPEIGALGLFMMVGGPPFQWAIYYRLWGWPYKLKRTRARVRWVCTGIVLIHVLSGLAALAIISKL